QGIPQHLGASTPVRGLVLCRNPVGSALLHRRKSCMAALGAPGNGAHQDPVLLDADIHHAAADLPLALPPQSLLRRRKAVDARRAA
nr:hypothetical protein [Tanacetum cinerariifolium]